MNCYKKIQENKKVPELFAITITILKNMVGDYKKIYAKAKRF